ncbi:MAG TPA: site-specific tyrosine recombinase/integron integrase [Flavobacteriaceae bacterium]|nr:tyrosine recombinase [Flavobacteriaceae bacterium]HJO71074.1 site-specific tyrosine recombinase/integron integrase [Flavobacteriaceae bacterium]
MDWNQAIKDYKSYLKIERGLSLNSIVSYENDTLSLKNYILDNKIKESPIECTPDTVNSFIYNSSKKNSPRSQARKISGLKSFFKFLVFEGYLKSSPMSNIESPKLGRKLPDILNVEEISQMISSINIKEKFGQRNKTIIEILYGTGIRVSELIELKISNIFFKENLIRVLGKGDKERFVPIGLKAKKSIIDYINNDRKYQKIEESSNDILILSKYGKKITRHMIFTLIKNISKKSGITKKISPHTFRHSFASHLLKNGADLRTIQLILGHENITTTEIYTHLDSKHLLNVMKKYHPRSM